ncbi:MAG: nuclear transport factor 2 family protein [Streptosporangiales bacterium]|nr:nuclear transport factor 2 family protein [Streptosporangiales bacterium]
MSSHESPADDAAIRNLLGLTALLGDTGDPEDYRRVYAPDATWTMGPAKQSGADEIVAATAARRGDGTSGPGTGTKHVVIPAVIEVDGDTATAVSHFVFLAGKEIRNAGTYHDTLVRTPDGWKISVRDITS